MLHSATWGLKRHREPLSAENNSACVVGPRAWTVTDRVVQITRDHGPDCISMKTSTIIIKSSATVSESDNFICLL